MICMPSIGLISWNYGFVWWDVVIDCNDDDDDGVVIDINLRSWTIVSIYSQKELI